MKKKLAKCFCVFLMIFSFLVAEDPYPSRFEGICEEYKDHPLDLIAALIPKEPVIFEAGGHYGIDTSKFAQKWPLAHIITFEPNPHAFQKLLDVCELHSNISPYPLAIGEFNGQRKFYVCYGTTGDNDIFEGASSLLPASEGMKIHYQGPIITVDCVILDDWCKENGIDHIDFMWLDLEGMELQVLKNSQEILKNVKVIYIETNFQAFRVGMTQYSELKKFLEDSGFCLLSHWYHENLQGNAIFLKRP